jgi:hypothetical protein
MVPLFPGAPGGVELIILLLIIGIPAAAFYFWGKSKGQSQTIERMDREQSRDE